MLLFALDIDISKEPPRRYIKNEKIPQTKFQKYRIDNNMTIKQFANLFGTSTASIIEIGRGRRTPHLNLALNIEEKTNGFITPYDWK